MIEFTYINKINTIIKDSNLNTGINPIAELNYGKGVSRILLYFDHSKVKRMIEDGIFADMSKLKHTLKITNSGSIDFTEVHRCSTSQISHKPKKRATSFDVIFFLIPKFWDKGKGFDYSRDMVSLDYYDYKNPKNVGRLISTDGCNWFQPRNGYKWDEEGVYSNETLANEYDKFSSEIGSNIIIGRQHFDVGNENINFDITDIFNKFITGEVENYGIGIAFSPRLERAGEAEKCLDRLPDNYVGFFTNNTHTFFAPYVETIYDNAIDDDRANFVCDKNNKLYLYCTIGGKLTNLDELPTCTVSDGYEYSEEYEVKQHSVGVYYIEINVPHDKFEDLIMLYDTWSNIKYQGTPLKDVELDFTLKDSNQWFTIGNKIGEDSNFTPSIYGIDNNESIFRTDEVRKVRVVSNKNYTKDTAQLVDDIYYRVYVLDGEREITVIPYDRMNKTLNENFFWLNFDMLLPQKYYIDIRYTYNNEVRTYKDVVHFKIVDNLNNKYI